MHESVDGYRLYFHGIVGFFVCEDHVLRCRFLGISIPAENFFGHIFIYSIFEHPKKTDLVFFIMQQKVIIPPILLN
jgi:hypothetical protein